MTADEAHQEAYQHVLPKLRRNIMSNYVQKIVDAAKLHKDPVHKRIMSTKRKLQEDDDYEAQEAIKYAVKKRKFLIQEATGTLSDDELDYDIKNRKRKRWDMHSWNKLLSSLNLKTLWDLQLRMNKLNHGR